MRKVIKWICEAFSAIVKLHEEEIRAKCEKYTNK